jgi:hypothetical protein
MLAALGFFSGFRGDQPDPCRRTPNRTTPPRDRACERVAATSWRTRHLAGFAYAHLHDVKGMAFVETPRAIIAKEAPPELLLELKCDCPMKEERRDYVAVENEGWTNRERISDIPLVVISNDYGDGYENEEQRMNVEDQLARFKLSPQARQVAVTSG